MDDETIAYAGVNGQRQLLRDRAVTSVQLLELSLARIRRLDPQIGAFRVLFDTARGEAEAADAALAQGDERPLLGVPVAVKDYLPVAGHAPAHGTASPQPTATEDAEIARRLRAAGAVIVGTTHLPELALWPFTESKTFGATRNPWDLDRTPGGSSGGSAAAVAAGMVAAAHASDGGGSIRIPAACCGLVGLKPTRGFVSLAPATDHWHGLSVAGCVTRTVADTVTVLNALQDRPLALTDPGRLRIAWSLKTPVPAPVDPQVKAALHRVMGRLAGLGHDVLQADPSYRGVQESFLVRYAAGAADDLEALADPSVTELRTRAVAALGRRLRGRPL
ncbi:MAG: amidase family protein, partial [Mycobacteriales bacterium]